MNSKKHINESQKDWGGYYSDNSTGTLSWNPSTPEDAMSVAKSRGKKPSDVYRGILKSKENYRGMELKKYGLPSDANLTNRREIDRKQNYEEPRNFNWDTKDYDWVTYSKDNNGYLPYNIPDHAGYSNEVPSNHSQRQQELQKTFNANDKKLRRIQKKAGVLNENTIRQIVEETLRRLIKEYKDNDLDSDYVDPDDWRSEEPEENYVQAIFSQIENKCNDSGAVFKNLGDNEFGVISRENNSYAVVRLLKSMEKDGIIYNTGGSMSEIGPWHAKFRVIRELSESSGYRTTMDKAGKNFDKTTLRGKIVRKLNPSKAIQYDAVKKKANDMSYHDGVDASFLALNHPDKDDAKEIKMKRQRSDKYSKK